MRPKTMRRLAVAGVVLAVTGGALAHGAGPARATTYLSVTLAGSPPPLEGVAQWDAAGDPVLSFNSAGTGAIATVSVNNVPPAAPAEAPSFTTDNYREYYGSGTPVWLLSFANGGWLYGYPSNAGLGTANWEAARGNCSNTKLAPTYGTYADALTVLANAGCGGDVTYAEIYGDGDQYPASDTITNIQYNGETLVPGPDVVTVANPGTQTGEAGMTTFTLPITASSVKGDGIRWYTAAGVPPGISFNPDGTFTGTPTRGGTFTTTVTATDGGFTTSGKMEFSWHISPVPSLIYGGTIQLTKMGLCLDDRGDGDSNGAVVQVWHCNGEDSQQWNVFSDGTIRHNGLCLDAKANGIANGTKVQLWGCTGAANQKWDTRNFRIHYDNPAAVNKVLDDTGHGGNGTQQQIWTNTGGTNQIWTTS